MTNDDIPYLGGETDPNSWHFKNVSEDGPLPNPVGHTFPLLTHDISGKWELIGTGFYVSPDGLFLTAKHVIDEVLNDQGKQISPLIILHPHSESGLFGASELRYRPIMQCWLSDKADIAFGVAATATNNKTGKTLRHWCWPLSWTMPSIGAQVATYAFPRHFVSEDGKDFCFSPESYSGTILEAKDYRDSVIIPFPYLSVDCRIHGGASGGPIIANGEVIGVNCSELTKTIDHPPGPGFGAQIKCIKDAYFDNGMLFAENIERRITIEELIHADHIRVRNYPTEDGDNSLAGTLVRLDEVPVTAPYPVVSFIQYF